ncbi:hypothetical protein J4Q44_G00112330 [Coregonus suidteri]|uniref:Kinesin motor domain-containing protein n=1 Tax=Coregonus suidteri TaxID=861788 RepID=A0AAN8LYY1_9TELE
MMGTKVKPGVNIRSLSLSSRSHLLLTLTVEGTYCVSGVTSHDTLTLCDLAGSELIAKTDAKRQRLVECES